MWIVDAVFETPGVGGAVAGAVILILIVCYGLTIKWISKGHIDTND
jgi:hypothetical protein